MSPNGIYMAEALPLTAASLSPWFRELAQSARTGIVLLEASAPVYANAAAIDLLCVADCAPERPALQRIGDALPRSLVDACRAGADPAEADVRVVVGREERCVRMRAVPLDEQGSASFLLVEERASVSMREGERGRPRRPPSEISKHVHDLRGPLNALGINAALLLRSLEGEPDKDETIRADQVETVRILQREVARLDRMLSALLRDRIAEQS